ncbi:metal-dependent transcriptional regulator [Trueperella bernardiae]|uniref:metal-dependent transcriptional regulator n=1 Tax=Trueperella bernardiae TaxID=59561 RepID=UPI0020447DE0|nr:metal-dependent transcriptional regulator [Trueperella bernardiae]MCM3907788.1 metal-dependent transcriptional regulator [Trueperella bernardiae]
MNTLSPSTEDYLKTIWSICEWSGDEVVPIELARRMGLSPSTVTEAVKKLSSQNLVSHRRYGPIRLTEEGLREALRVVRKHRLIETYLHTHLGYAWHELHDEAEALEHAVSARFIDAIDDLLGHPLRDPHGDPIPQPDGSMPAMDVFHLHEAAEGAPVVIEQVDDDDADVLIYLGDLGVRPGKNATVTSQSAVLGLTTIEIDGQSIALPNPAARRVRVTIPER